MLKEQLVNGDNSVIPLIIGAFATLTAGLLALFKIVLNSSSKEREADRKERQALTDALTILGQGKHEQAEATKELVAETRKGNEEAKQRNGHLGEQSIQIAQMIADNTNIVMDAVQNIAEQHIVKQTIDKQVIKK